MFRRSKLLLMVVGILACTLAGYGTARARSNYFLTTVRVQNVGAFLINSLAYDSAGAPTNNSVGGHVRIYISSTQTLNIGDVVYIDTLNKVDKSTTIANYNKLAGVVVGGRSTGMQASIASADVGSAAAAVGRPVIVMRDGRAWVKNDAAGNLTSGGLIAPSGTVAGAVTVKPASIDSLFRVFGRAINGGAASATILAEVNAK